jgi:hypothetical protein
MSKLRHTRVLLPLIAAFLAVALVRCGKTPTSTPASGTFGSVYSTFNSAGCAECHAPSVSASAAHGSSLDLSSQSAAYSTLVGTKVTATDSTSTCGNVSLVVAGNPSQSYLAAVLFSSYNTANFVESGCTPYNAHLSDQHLTSDEQTSIISWIQNGAQNN